MTLRHAITVTATAYLAALTGIGAWALRDVWAVGTAEPAFTPACPAAAPSSRDAGSACPVEVMTALAERWAQGR